MPDVRARNRVRRSGNAVTLAPFESVEHYRSMGFQPPDERINVGPAADLELRLLLRSLHRQHQQAWGYLLPTCELMARLVQVIQDGIAPNARILDAGSGSGFLSRELCRLGVESFAVDKCEYENPERKYGYAIIEVHQRDALGDAADYVSRGFDAILMTWPPHNWSFAHDIAKAMLPGQWLIYEGESNGCCADDAFFEYLKKEQVWERHNALGDWLNEVHVTFPGLDDCWTVWRKK